VSAGIGFNTFYPDETEFTFTDQSPCPLTVSASDVMAFSAPIIIRIIQPCTDAACNPLIEIISFIGTGQDTFSGPITLSTAPTAVAATDTTVDSYYFLNADMYLIIINTIATQGTVWGNSSLPKMTPGDYVLKITMNNSYKCWVAKHMLKQNKSVTAE